ncbi:putative disease resistance protein RGA3 [Aegilops tauschii subsp. strangulata]|uniref:Protein kinase domain-containing protein n=6 Tax=Aegilops tauschii subsp. strangulata TaxID=200361 RepID=A0A453T1S0_AEGTS|nr:putative disease resistance protein RGA1 [Aegilops tauschii subsp. strangulata]XP_020195945.1 putative disease resistance protein RGA1 [Aegilops tauschii subsp. strangulata]
MLNSTSGATSPFSFELLRQITDNFSDDRVIGHGAYGVVYKGVLDNGEKIAVKKLKYMPPEYDSDKQFENECTNLMRVQHHNIVRLVGYCHETRREYVEHGGKYVFASEDKRVLCFEYLQGGSLDKHVSDESCKLDWDTCYKIIKGVCEGLNHLHNDSIFHLDLKPANILLDNNMMPKIGDFGLSRFFPSTETYTTTTCYGTLGYIPPEHINNHQISPKYDVFSLGVIIIQIMAGRKGYNDHGDTTSLKFIESVCEKWQKRVHATMWSHISQEVKTCIEIALSCVESDRQKRPTISQIVNALKMIDIEKLSLTCEAQSMQALVHNQYTTSSASMGVHDGGTRFESTPDEVGGDDRSTHASMYQETAEPIDYEYKPIIRNPAPSAIGGHADRDIWELQNVTQTSKENILDYGPRNSNIRVEGSLHTPVTIGIMDAIGVISGFKECDYLFQWARSTILSQFSGTNEQGLDEELFRLKNGLQCLRDTLPAMYELIDRAEWRSHKHYVAELLPKLRDGVYDAEDLLDEFRWYMLKVKVDGNGSQSSFMDFFNSVIRGSFNKVDSIQKRLDNISMHLRGMGLHDITIRFDKSVRPETSSFPDETKIFGRDMELKQIIELFCAPRNSSDAHPKRQKGNSALDVSTSTSARNQVGNESRISDLLVLPIVGIGGVGKTTLAQHICSHEEVESHFDKIIWVCVSDDFDVKRLTKEVIQSCSEKYATTENLNLLQKIFSDIARTEKLLIVLDDMWDDVLKENRKHWNRFCAPLRNVLPGSMMLITTRSPQVADKVGTMDPITLEGLEDDAFWKFFEVCVFESGSSSNNDPELEHIGRRIVPKLQGSPLAAKTLGRILRMNLQVAHWNDVLESELWKLSQEETEILPALRLSYMYLPFRLKRCFSFCAVYPKDYQFQKDRLAEIWVAEGFVEPQGDTPLQDIGCEYFNDLLNRSFFQEVHGKYLIHDLLHDMAQKVSEHECFIVERESDFNDIPPNVRHLSILFGGDIDNASLLSLYHLTKLRTLLCEKPLANKKTPASLMEKWLSKLLYLRVIVCDSTNELPAIGNLKHLRYLQILSASPFKSLPAEFCRLYNLQILRLEKCILESLPDDFSSLICLQRLESHGFQCNSRFRSFQRELYYEVSVDVANGEQGSAFRCIKNINQLGELVMYNIDKQSKEHAAEAQLQNKKYLEMLNLSWYGLRSPEDNDIEVLRVLQPPTCLKILLLNGYPGVSLPRWSASSLSDHINPSEILEVLVDNANDITGIFPVLTELVIDKCQNLSCLEHILHPDCVPAIREITIKDCKNLVSVPAERFGDLRCLEEFTVQGCPNISFRSLVAPSLKRLVLGRGDDYSYEHSCGNFADNIDCCSLTYFFLSSYHLTSIQLQMWNLPALEELEISNCESLTSIIGQSGQVLKNTGGSRAFPSLASLSIVWCHELSTMDDLLAEDYIPAIEKICIKFCISLKSLPGERFWKFSSLRDLEISGCGRLSWKNGFFLPSSLQRLALAQCGDISAWVPDCLENLTSLVTLEISLCRHITSIPGSLWSTNLTSLENLSIENCADIVSIGGENAISEIQNVWITGCPGMEELKRPMVRGKRIP